MLILGIFFILQINAPPAIDVISRNWIKFPVWGFDIYKTKRPAYCRQPPFQFENFG
ncbi:hypothetical protein T4B_6641 [Trichinella pseudospiralis]|uniref:Uncharacterized protein n=1 Tax=Trichinella pseudospiralis TaxID=6337 RepID=A0A0V1GQ37_TRIPS|nr:hypothetical protein T4B_6641 [Trichinella pseudospiralis]KRZ31568.1 hypothetical protein T4C_5920 [Trichinella pseudospiralis]